MESPAEDAAGLRRRATLLAIIHLVLATSAIAVLVLVVWRVRLLVTLAQRSNVETLVIAFVVVFLLYLLVTTMPATAGALRLFGYRAMARDRAQRSLQRKVRRDKKRTQSTSLNVLVRGPDGGDVVIPIEDRFGKICTLRIRLAEVRFEDAPEELTHALQQIVVKTLEEVGTLEGTDQRPRMIFWSSIDESQSAAWVAQVSAFDQLERALDASPLWPTLRVDRKGVARLEETMRQCAPWIRESLLLPDIEYSAEFTIPIIPEPFAFMQLTRKKDHADAVASMGCATIVALVFLAVIAWVLVNPPWVPGI